jgi:endonuclease/exonuclease/phosphatase family metal-dependent hydrolase
LAATQPQQLRLVTFNIERGYQLPLVIQQLQALDADIIALQEVCVSWVCGCTRRGRLAACQHTAHPPREPRAPFTPQVDVGCERSGGVDTGAAIAAALQLNYLFTPEFLELRSPLRDARSQGGGWHGNAVLSK